MSFGSRNLGEFRHWRFPARMLACLAYLACSALCCVAFACMAESPTSASTGTLDGKLTDWHSIPLAQASITIRNLSTGATTSGVTGKNGSYRFTGLGPGEYRLEADIPSLGKGAVDGIFISAGHATRMQAALVMQAPLPPAPPELDLGPEVRELDPVTPAVTAMIPTEELSAAPASTRDWQEFAAITPASNPISQSGHSGQNGDETISNSSPNSGPEPLDAPLSIEGASGIEASSSIDGMAIAPAFQTAQPASQSVFQSDTSRSNRATESVGASAIEVMQTRTGNASSGALNLITAHGQNGLHGQAFYLNRQSLWGAQNPFTQRIEQTAPVNGVNIAQFTPEPYSPPNSRQTLGLGIGRQLKRDKLFWFAALDGLLSNDPAVASVRHPDDFFAQPTNDQLTVLAARLDLPEPAILEEGASAYSAGLGQLNGLLGPVPRTTSQWQGFARVDWHIGERQHLSIEGQGSDENSPGGGLSSTSETYGSHSFGNSQASDAWALAKLDSFLTPNLLNAAAVQFQHRIQGDTAQTPSAFEAPLIANEWDQLPEIIADSKYGFILGKPARLASPGSTKNPDEQILATQDMLSWVHGSHLIKAGAYFDHTSDAVDSLLNQTGTYSYADVLNFLSDTASFTQYGFGSVGGVNSPQHNCDATGQVHNESGTLTGLGYLPCYAWYSQRIGPSDWSLSTNDLAAFATEQWQPLHNLTLSAGLRLEVQQLPPPLIGVANSALPQTLKLPAATLNWGPRIGIAYAPLKRTVIRAGAGLYYGRIDNSTVLAALTQTGSTSGDLNFFFKPTDNGAPPFPFVFPVEPQAAVTPGAVSFAASFRPQEVDQAVLSVEQELPSHWLISASALASLGRRLPISMDTNLVPAQNGDGNPQTITYAVVDALQAGPIKTPTVTVPFYTTRTNTSYQQLDSIESRANSTYDAAMFKIVRYGSHGLSLHAHYLYAHATDWNPNESGNVAVNDVFDPHDFRLEYGTSNLDIRHSAAATVLYTTPWKIPNWAGQLANAWSVAAVGQFRSGLPYTMRTSGYVPGFYNDLEQLIQGVGPGMNGSGGDNRVYGVGRNTYRYPATWTGDARLTKRFNLAHNRQLELLAESFNLFNHQNVTLIETTGYTIDRGATSGELPTLNFMTGLTSAGLPSPTSVEFGKPLDVNATNYYRPREIQLGVRARF